MPLGATRRGPAAKHLAPAAVALALGLLLPQAPGAEAPLEKPLEVPRSAPLSLSFEIHAGGLHVFSSDSVIALRPTGYEATVDVRTDGWLAWLLDLKLAAKVEGAAGPSGFAPHRFRSESEWRDRTRWVEVTYGPDGRPKIESKPPAEDDDRDPVPEDLRLGTIDPISAALALVHTVQGGGRCEGEAAIFDGRRRFAAKVSDAGRTTLAKSDLAPYGGPARACRLIVVPLAGFWRNPKYPPKTQELTIYRREIADGWPPLPVRVEAETSFGAVRAHLVGIAAATPTQKAAR